MGHMGIFTFTCLIIMELTIVPKDTFSSHGSGPMVQAVIDIPYLVRSFSEEIRD